MLFDLTFLFFIQSGPNKRVLADTTQRINGMLKELKEEQIPQHVLHSLSMLSHCKLLLLDSINEKKNIWIWIKRLHSTRSKGMGKGNGDTYEIDDYRIR